MTIKELRELTGYSQSQFCMMLGIPVRTYCSWESGERKPAKYVLDLIENWVLGVHEIPYNTENGNYTIGIQYNQAEKVFGAWLGKERLGIKTFMFGIPKTSLATFQEIVLANVDDYLDELNDYE